MKKIKYPNKELRTIIILLMDLGPLTEETTCLLKQIDNFANDLKNYLSKYYQVENYSSITKE